MESETREAAEEHRSAVKVYTHPAATDLSLSLSLYIYIHIEEKKRKSLFSTSRDAEIEEKPTIRHETGDGR